MSLGVYTFGHSWIAFALPSSRTFPQFVVIIVAHIPKCLQSSSDVTWNYTTFSKQKTRKIPNASTLDLPRAGVEQTNNKTSQPSSGQKKHASTLDLPRAGVEQTNNKTSQPSSGQKKHASQPSSGQKNHEHHLHWTRTRRKTTSDQHIEDGIVTW
jgi:hypothetical protein